MKKFLFIIITFTCIFQLNAQVKEGTIIYERKINFWKRIQSEERRAVVPEFRVTNHVLYFNDSISLYKTFAAPEEDFNSGDGSGFGGGGGFGGGRGGGRFSRMMGGMDGDLFKNLSEGISTQATEQAGRNFLITDTIKKQSWKIAAETKVILGYTCRKATLKQKSFGGGGFGGGNRNRQGSDNNNSSADTARRNRAATEVDVVTWFAEGIPASVGPESYGQLPGAILSVDVDNGFMVYTATDIKKTVSEKDLKEPKKGKKVTRQEYRKMMEEAMKNFGGNGGVDMTQGSPQNE
ncbi:GLPGLI family protein [Parasediminibacterium sp. JCM 36343]|uniref:GLPGLI family protein n=1 Tax=Parasediminibacterium sp. JCM 36343 TaxID=3374279 RepID=UPI00397831D2